MSQPWKLKEQRACARLQAVDGTWPKRWPPVTSTGRVGHLGPQGAPIHVDGLTKRHVVEVKSSRRAAANPGHRVTKDALKKLLSEATELSAEFGTELRPAYAIDITDAGGVQWMIPEEWFFRYLRAFETLIENGEQQGDGTTRESIIAELDEEVQFLINENCSERYR